MTWSPRCVPLTKRLLRSRVICKRSPWRCLGHGRSIKMITDIHLPCSSSTLHEYHGEKHSEPPARARTSGIEFSQMRILWSASGGLYGTLPLRVLAIILLWKYYVCERGYATSCLDKDAGFPGFDALRPKAAASESSLVHTLLWCQIVVSLSLHGKKPETWWDYSRKLHWFI